MRGKERDCAPGRKRGRDDERRGSCPTGGGTSGDGAREDTRPATTTACTPKDREETCH